MTCDECWHYRPRYRFCDMLGREVSKDAKACFWFSPRKQKDEGKNKR